MTEIPRRTLVTMMNALSSGVVPRRGLEYIAVGRRRETETFVNDLEDTAEFGPVEEDGRAAQDEEDDDEDDETEEV